MKKIVVVLTCIGVFFGTETSFAETVTLGGIIRCPYVCDSSSDTPGFLIEIANHAFGQQGDTVRFRELPWPRAIDYARNGNIDGLIGATRKNAPDLIFPEEESGVSQMRFYINKETPWRHQGLVSLKGVTLGIVRGVSYGEMDSYLRVYGNNNTKVQPVTRLTQNLRKLESGRITAILEDYMVMNSLLHQEGKTAQIVEAGRLNRNNLYIAFGAKNPKSNEYTELISNTIRQLRSSGKLDTMLKKYGLIDWRKENVATLTDSSDVNLSQDRKEQRKISLKKGETLTLQFATANNASSSHGVFALKFKEALEKYSEGKIKVNCAFKEKKWGSEQDIAIQTSSGDLDMGSQAVNNISPFAPVIGVMSLPYIFIKWQSAWKFIHHPYMEKINDQVVKSTNFRVLGWVNVGYRVLFNSKKKVTKPEDLRGLKIRVPTAPVLQETWRSWDTEPVPVAWSKMYDAYKGGMVDGGGNSVTDVKAMGFHKYTKHITTLHYNFLVGSFIINEDIYQSLPDDLRQSVDKATLEAEKHQWDWAEKSTMAVIDFFKDQGIVVVEPADNEKEWIKKARTIWPMFYESVGGKEVIDNVMKIIEGN